MVLISERLPAPCVAKLRELGQDVVPLPADPRLAAPVASHPDMLLFLSQNTLITDRIYYETFAQKQIDRICAASKLYLHLTDESPRAEYPYDIRFNAARVGRFLFCYPEYTSPAILSLAANKGWTIVPVRQGYARCSLCPVSDRALITSDPSIARAAEHQKDLDVLTVHQGHILLPGYSHGFIGGCCGTDRDHLYFSGNLALYPDGNAMVSFARAHGITAVILSHDKLFDGGSLFFVPCHSDR